MVFLRREYLRRVRLARTLTGNVPSDSTFGGQPEIVRGRSRPWTNEQVEKASILRLLFSEVRSWKSCCNLAVFTRPSLQFVGLWGRKDLALQVANVTDSLLTDASRDGR
jgi:hypothetical protein